MEQSGPMTPARDDATAAAPEAGASLIQSVPDTPLHLAEFVPWRILLVTVFASVLSNLDQSLFGYAVPSVMGDLNVDIAGIGWMISISFALSVVVVPLIAAQVARIGVPAVLALSVACSALLVGLLGLAPGPRAFAALRITGFAISMAIIPIASAYLATHSPHRGRALIMAILQCGYPLGCFIAAMIAAPLLTTYGWRATFLVAFAAVLLSPLIFWLLPEAVTVKRMTNSASRCATAASRSPSEQPATVRDLLAPGRRRLTMTYGVAYFLYGGGVGGVGFYLPTFFQQARGYDAATATHVVGISYLVAMIGYVGAAIISEIWLSRRATVVLWLLAAGLALLATIWLPRTAGQDMLVFAITSIFLFGTASIMITSLLEEFPTRLRTIAAAILSTACISGGLVLFPISIAGVVKLVGWAMGLTLVLVPALLAAGLLILSLPRRHAEPEAAAVCG
jgi:MFS family permease